MVPLRLFSINPKEYTVHFHDYKQHMDVLVTAALDAADPGANMVLDTTAHLLESAEQVWVVGVGKASLEMAFALHKQLKARITGGAMAVVPARLQQLDQPLPFEAHPAAHPLPDERNLRAARAIAAVAQGAQHDDLLIALISGGGSAHLTLPAADVDLQAYQSVVDQLMKAGAPIEELNAVRKHAEQLKGGGLLRLAAPARVHALVLSDVIGDPLDVIASGPVTADPTTFHDALDVLTRYEIDVPSGLLTYLKAGQRGEQPETVKPGDPLLERVSTEIIGSNATAVEAVKQAAERLGFSVAHVETGVEGEAREVGAWLAQQAKGLRARTPCAILLGGETTVTVRGTGRGGRNQELVLAAALTLDGSDNIAVMSLATDGIDGPTDAAGAFADGETCSQARELGLDPAAYLADNNSWAFFDAVGTLFRMGPTGTNVNDVTVALIYPS